MRACVVLLGIALATSAARADGITAHEPVRETQHRVELRIVDGTALYRVHRTLHNSGAAEDRVYLSIDVPDDAVVVGLRLQRDGAWTEAQLAANASVKNPIHDQDDYDDDGAPKPVGGPTRAVFAWHNPHQLTLNLESFPSRASITIEYTLLAPTRYEEGRHWALYLRPREADQELELPQFVVQGAVVVDGVQHPSGEPFTLAPRETDEEAEGTHEVAHADADVRAGKEPLRLYRDSRLVQLGVVAPVAAPWTVRYSHVPTGDGAAIARVELDVARKMSPLPRRAQVVFVVDASRSVTARDRDRTRLIMGHYLAHVPDAQVEVIAMRRHATRLFNDFLEAPAASAALAQPGILAPGNGSALAEALALAAQTIASRPGPRRIVILTDERLPTRLAAPAVIAALARLAPDDIVHLVALTDPWDGPKPLTYEHEGPLAPLAHRHHGLYVTMKGDFRGTQGAAAVLELVRPIRISDLRAVGIELGDSELFEGEGLRAIKRVGAPAREIEITGRLWSDPIALRVASDARWSSQTAALALNHNLALSATAQATLAARGHAVSPVTSLVIAGGYLPQPSEYSGPLDEVFHPRTTWRDYYDAVDIPTAPPLSGLLDPALCIARVHPPAHWRVVLDIETTDAEIVDVTSARTDPMTACLIEEAWQLDLPGGYGERAQHRVELRR